MSRQGALGAHIGAPPASRVDETVDFFVASSLAFWAAAAAAFLATSNCLLIGVATGGILAPTADNLRGADVYDDDDSDEIVNTLRGLAVNAAQKRQHEEFIERVIAIIDAKSSELVRKIIDAESIQLVREIENDAQDDLGITTLEVPYAFPSPPMPCHEQQNDLATSTNSSSSSTSTSSSTSHGAPTCAISATNPPAAKFNDGHNGTVRESNCYDSKRKRDMCSLSSSHRNSISPSPASTEV